MTIESFQDTLFEDPIGLRFRHARVKRSMTLEAVAQSLKLPVAVLDAIEREDWARLGAPIFVRSYVGSYARFLGLPAALADDVVRGKPAPQLAPVGSNTRGRRGADRGLMKLAYLAMTILIVGSVVMLAMYFQGPRRSSQVVPIDPPAVLSAAQEATPVMATPVMASMAPDLRPTVAPRELVLEFTAASWIEVLAPDGNALERGIVNAGELRRFDTGAVSRVTLGQASAVKVSLGGAEVELQPFVEADIARFTVSSAGSVAPASGG